MTSVWPPHNVVGETTGLERGTAPVADWAVAPERSNRATLRLMAWIAVHLGRRVARLVLHPITLYFLCFAPTARRHSGRYLQRVFGRPPRLAERYRHFHAFAATVLDRIYFVRGAMHEFEFAIHGEALIDASLAEGQGAFLLGAHIGSFEALHAVGTSRPGMRVAMVMYPDNARLIQGVLQSVAPDLELGIITIGRAGSTLAIRDWLDGGGLAGLLGDRFLPAGPHHRSGSVALPFLGRVTHFADGPLRLAQLLRRRVIFMVGLYHGGRRYEVRFLPLADFRQREDDADARERQVQQALGRYVALLESLVRERPFNWFNFHDFWKED